MKQGILSTLEHTPNTAWYVNVPPQPAAVYYT